jgi:hypothetical protein
MSPFYREAMKLHSGLAVMTPEAMSDEVYSHLEQELGRFSNATYLEVTEKCPTVFRSPARRT